MGDKSYHPCSAERELKPEHFSWKRRILLNMQQSCLANLKLAFLPREPVNTIWPLSVDIFQNLKHSDNLNPSPVPSWEGGFQSKKKSQSLGQRARWDSRLHGPTISQLMPVCLGLPPLLLLGEACRLIGALPGCELWGEGHGEELGLCNMGLLLLLKK